MKKIPNPITKENFSEAFTSIAKLYNTNFKYVVIRNVVQTVSTILFILLSLITTIGFIYAGADAEDMMVFAKLEFLTPHLDKFVELMGKLPEMWYVRVPVCIVAIFVIPFIVCGIISLVLALTVKGKVPTEEPTGTDLEKAKGLHAIAGKIPGTVYGSEDSQSVCALISAIAYVLIMLAFVVFSILTVETDLTISAIISIAIGVLVAAAIAFYVIYIVNLIFNGFIGLYYAGEKSRWSITKITDAYWLENDPAERAHRAELERKAAAEREARKAREAKEAAEAKERSYECHHCVYYYVDSNYDGYCKLDDSYKDRYQKACSKFRK